MVKVGLIGIGAMGRGHYDYYVQLMEEGFPVKLVAICDVDSERLQGKGPGGNIGHGKEADRPVAFPLVLELRGDAGQ